MHHAEDETTGHLSGEGHHTRPDRPDGGPRRYRVLQSPVPGRVVVDGGPERVDDLPGDRWSVPGRPTSSGGTGRRSGGAAVAHRHCGVSRNPGEEPGSERDDGEGAEESDPQARPDPSKPPRLGLRALSLRALSLRALSLRMDWTVAQTLESSMRLRRWRSALVWI